MTELAVEIFQLYATPLRQPPRNTALISALYRRGWQWSERDCSMGSRDGGVQAVVQGDPFSWGWKAFVLCEIGAVHMLTVSSEGSKLISFQSPHKPTRKRSSAFCTNTKADVPTYRTTQLEVQHLSCVLCFEVVVSESRCPKP